MWHHIFQPLSLWHLCSSSRRGGANTVSRYPPSALVKRGRTAVKGEKEEKHWQDEQQFPKHGVDSRFRPAQPFCSCHQSWNHGVLQVGECVCVCVLPGFKSYRETREKKKNTELEVTWASTPSKFAFSFSSAHFTAPARKTSHLLFSLWREEITFTLC